MNAIIWKVLAGIFVLGVGAAIAQDGTQIAFPDGYRTWFHHHSTVNLVGHAPEGNIGIQHVYANPLAVEGLRSGKFEKGATFVVDRLKYVESDNSRLQQGDRKVIAVMIRDEALYPETGGWGFEAFKGGDPGARVVKDAKACFVCHIPNADNNFLFSRGLQYFRGGATLWFEGFTARASATKRKARTAITKR
ncbi:MAG: cytochrome P460 family protein [Burkholderiales bacterium]